jgi:hypothetical protein
MKMKGYPCSNLDRSIYSWRLGRLLPPWLGSADVERHGCSHGWRPGAQAWPTGLQTWRQLLLHDLEGNRVSFYSLLVKQMIHEGLAAAACSSRPSTASPDLSGASPAPRSSSKVLPCSPQAPPQFNCFRLWWVTLVRWLYLCARVWCLRDEIRRTRAAIYRAFGMDL